jgi:hypothetical protein
MAELIYQASPLIVFATNSFINVPVILQYEDTPLLEVVQEVQAGFTTQFSIYHEDGRYLAKVKGSQLYPTKEGRMAGLVLRHPQGKTISELNGSPLVELTRSEAAAFRNMYNQRGLSSSPSRSIWYLPSSRASRAAFSNSSLLRFRSMLRASANSSSYHSWASIID